MDHDNDIVLADRYRVVRELGRGAMGTVYLAEDLMLEGVEMAIKMPSTVLMKSKKALAALKKEALLARRLVHPNIVPLRTFEENANGAFLVMDYVEGETLEARVERDGPLSEAEAIRLFTPLGDALDYAHAQGVIHRDVKPSNIMIRKDGAPLLMDFGVAREAKDTLTRLTGLSTSGTLPYMSPEQLRGATPTPAQDIYGLAATMYECLAGHPPFHRGEISWQILNEMPAPVGVPGSVLSRAILRGLAKDPAERLASCRALVGLGKDAASPRSGGGPHGPRSGRPVRYGLRILVVACLLLLPAAGWWWFQGRDPRVRHPQGAPPAWEASITTFETAMASDEFRAARRSMDEAVMNGIPVARVPERLALRLQEWERPPEVVVEHPKAGERIAGRTVSVRGRMTGFRASDRVRVDGEDVRVESDGRFHHEITLLAVGEAAIEIRVEDGVEPRLPAPIRIRVVMVEPYEADLLAFDAAIAEADYATARGRLDAALMAGASREGLSAESLIALKIWEARPEVTLEVPRAGDRVTSGTVIKVRGSLVSGRPSDRVYVGDEPATMDARGRFTLEVAAPGSSAPYVEVHVRDGEEERLTPPLRIPLVVVASYEEDLDAFVRAAEKGDFRGARKYLSRAEAKGCPARRVPSGPRAALAAWEAPPAVVMTSPRPKARVVGTLVKVQGSVKGHRETDEFRINDTPVPIRNGTFSATVRFPGTGPKQIRLVIQDAGQVRWQTVLDLVVSAQPSTPTQPRALEPPAAWVPYIGGKRPVSTGTSALRQSGRSAASLLALRIAWTYVDRVSTGAEPFAGLTVPTVVLVIDPRASPSRDEGSRPLFEIVLRNEKVALATRACRMLAISAANAEKDPLLRGHGRSLPRVLLLDPVKKRVKTLENKKIKTSTLYKLMKSACGYAYKEKLDKVVKSHLKLLNEGDKLQNEKRVLQSKLLDSQRARPHDVRAVAKLKAELARVQRELAGLESKVQALWNLTPK